jgi:hypothetical protein
MSPRPAPSCHWTCLLILDAGTREPRMQRLVARNIVRLMHACTLIFKKFILFFQKGKMVWKRIRNPNLEKENVGENPRKTHKRHRTF